MASGISQLGLLEWLTDWLGNAFTGMIVEPIVNFISYWVGGFLYGIQMGFFYIIDAVSCLFRKAAGLDIYYQDGMAVEGDLVVQFLQSSTVQAVFLSILVAAIILLFVTTFIAVLKTEFDEKDNSKSGIFKSALKAIAYFAIVPVVCFLGILVSNMVLKMLDGATSRGAVSFSTQIFTAASWDANRARNESGFAQEIWEGRNGEFSYIPGLANLGAYDQGAIADLIDNAFRTAAVPISENNTASFTTVGDSGLGQKTRTFTVFSTTNYQLVYYFYNPMSYNYIIGYIASFTIVMLLLNLLIGVIQRIFELCVLFVLSPISLSLMPLDGGDRYKSWRGAFVKRVFSAYGPIMGLNLVFMVLTLMQGVTLFPPTGGINGLYNAIVQLIFIFTGLVSIRSLVDLVTDLVGQGDALKQGESTGKEVKKLGAKTIGQAGNLAMEPLRFAKHNVYDRVANRRQNKKAMDNLMYNPDGTLATDPNADGVVRGSELRKGASASARLRAWGQRRIGTDTDPDNIDLQHKVKTRDAAYDAAKKFLDEGGAVPVYDKEGNATDKTKAYKRHETKSQLQNFAEATPVWKMLEEGSKSFGKGAPIAGNIAGYFKGKADDKALKDTKDKIKMENEARAAIAKDEAKAANAKAATKRASRVAQGLPAEENQNNNNNNNNNNQNTLTSNSNEAVNVNIVGDERNNNDNNNQDYVINMSDAEINSSTVTDENAEININDATTQSTNTSSTSSTITSNSVDLDTKSTSTESGKVEIDDNKIVEAINDTKKGIMTRLSNVEAGINKVASISENVASETKETRKTTERIKENLKNFEKKNNNN